MSKRLSYFVEGTPIPQPRQRFTSRGGFVRAYMPTKHPVQLWKQSIALRTRHEMERNGVERFSGPVEVAITFVLPRPSSKTRKTKPNPREWHTGRGDLDNHAKSFLDAMTGIAFDDDGQVAALSVLKVVASGDEKPGAQIVLKQLHESELPF